MAIDPTLLSKVKTTLRISHNALDDDLADCISACLKDLSVCGVQAPVHDDPQETDPQETDPLILNAVKLYCRAEFTDDTGKAADYMARYNALKSCLMMAGDYREATGDE